MDERNITQNLMNIFITEMRCKACNLSKFHQGKNNLI